MALSKSFNARHRNICAGEERARDLDLLLESTISQLANIFTSLLT